MKNKLFLAFAAVLFAAITVFNLNLSQQETAGDITLVGVEMVAGAQIGEIIDEIDDCPGGQSCNFTQYGRDGVIDWSCTACCYGSYVPFCGPLGCTCQ